MSEEDGLAMIQQTLDGLHRSGLMKDRVLVQSSTVLLGTGSPLDSLAFVTFVADLEDQLNRETGKELSVVLTEVHDFNEGVTYLSAETMVRYLVQLTNGK